MKILFGKYFEGGAYPGTTADAPCLFGEVRTGPMGLLRILETHLGLSGHFPPPAVRAAALTKVLEKTPGFWSASAKEAPLAVAARLLAWREELSFAGVDWEKASPRLEQLYKVTGPLADEFPGPSDRLHRIIRRAEENPLPITTLHLFDPQEAIPPLWNSLFQSLEKKGIDIRAGQRPVVTAKGNLKNCLTKPFAPNGDGSLQLLQAPGPCEAAENLAAWLASLGDDLDGTVILGADPALDEALHRFGLPTVGAVGDRTENSLLEILPLLVECGWQPPDPAKVIELLSLPATPIPPFLAGPLADSLAEWPAVGSHHWQATMADRLAGLQDAEDRRRLQDRLAVIFTSSVPREKPYPAEELNNRVQLLESWARGRMLNLTDLTNWTAILQQCENFRRLLAVSGRKSFTESHLLSLLEQASADLSPAPRRPQSAGLTYIGHPGALIGPARRTIWWNFTSAAVSVPRTFPATAQERAAFEKGPMKFPEPGTLMVQEAANWRLPFTQTSETLILVVPQAGPGGAQTFHHPFWDEILANAAHRSALGCLTVTVPRSAKPLKTARRTLRPLPGPRPEWTLPKGVTIPSRKESVTSITSLIRCPFQYVAQYVGKAYPGRSAALPAERTLMGNLIHFLVAEFLRDGRRTRKKEDWQALADKLFDERAPSLAAPFFLPGGEVWRTKARRALALALRVIGELRQSLDGFDTLQVEEEILGSAFGGEFCGTPDVLLATPPAIIDLKWSGQKYRLDELRQGTCTQLAGYGALVKQARRLKGFPPAAFLILETGHLLTGSGDEFPGSLVAEGPPLEDTWQSMEKAHADRRKTLAKNLVEALGNLAEAGEDDADAFDVESGTLHLRPGCERCAFGHLCGRAFGG